MQYVCAYVINCMGGKTVVQVDLAMARPAGVAPMPIIPSSVYKKV